MNVYIFIHVSTSLADWPFREHKCIRPWQIGLLGSTFLNIYFLGTERDSILIFKATDLELL